MLLWVQLAIYNLCTKIKLFLTFLLSYKSQWHISTRFLKRLYSFSSGSYGIISCIRIMTPCELYLWTSDLISAPSISHDMGHFLTNYWLSRMRSWVRARIWQKLLLHRHNPCRALRSASANVLSVARSNLSFGSHAFRIAAPTVWNSLPPHVRSCTTLITFRKHLKLSLIHIWRCRRRG